VETKQIIIIIIIIIIISSSSFKLNEDQSAGSFVIKEVHHCLYDTVVASVNQWHP